MHELQSEMQIRTLSLFYQSFLTQIQYMLYVIQARAKVEKDMWEDNMGFVGGAPSFCHGVIVKIIQDWCLMFTLAFSI